MWLMLLLRNTGQDNAVSPTDHLKGGFRVHLFHWGETAVVDLGLLAADGGVGWICEAR